MVRKENVMLEPSTATIVLGLFSLFNVIWYFAVGGPYKFLNAFAGGFCGYGVMSFAHMWYYSI